MLPYAGDKTQVLRIESNCCLLDVLDSHRLFCRLVSSTSIGINVFCLITMIVSMPPEFVKVHPVEWREWLAEHSCMSIGYMPIAFYHCQSGVTQIFF
jgi:hypothetical protein